MYQKTEWKAGQSPAINDVNLNKIEQGIYDAHFNNVKLAYHELTLSNPDGYSTKVLLDSSKEIVYAEAWLYLKAQNGQYVTTPKFPLYLVATEATPYLFYTHEAYPTGEEGQKLHSVSYYFENQVNNIILRIKSQSLFEKGIPISFGINVFYRGEAE